MYEEEIRIPKDRVAVIIGTKGSVKRNLQKRLNVKIQVNSETGLISLAAEDSLNLYSAKLVLKAIGRGFNPDVAVQLEDEDKTLDILNIDDYSNDNKSKQLRIKSRLIGTKGKSRRIIEKLTNTNIEVYGKTVSIIGDVNDAVIARQALERLMHGAKHSNVYAFIEKKKSSKL